MITPATVFAELIGSYGIVLGVGLLALAAVVVSLVRSPQARATLRPGQFFGFVAILLLGLFFKTAHAHDAGEAARSGAGYVFLQILIVGATTGLAFAWLKITK